MLPLLAEDSTPPNNADINEDYNGLNDVCFIEEVSCQSTDTHKATQVSTAYCKGYVPANIQKLFLNFPFQLLEDTSFIHANGVFHCNECAVGNFVCQKFTDINDCCEILAYDSTVKKIVTLEQSPQINNLYLTFSHLENKIDKLEKQRRLLTIEKYKLNNKAARLGKTLSLHKRFLLEISRNNIPRLHNLALKNRCSINYILEKCKDAVDGIYRARAGQDDKDLAFLVLKFGGTSLLDILFQANVLPSTSFAYWMSKNCKPISSSVSMSVKDCFESNATLAANVKCSYSIKSDETYINPRLRYNSRTNEIVGVCYEHHDNVNLKFNGVSDA